MPSLPPPPPLPSTPPPAPFTPLETLAAELAKCQRELRAWTERRENLLIQFEELHAKGLAPEKFVSHGITYARQQGRTYDYSGCPDVIQTQETLKDLQEQAKAAGLAVIKPSKPTWKVTGPRHES
jgi:hypothetical protein